MSDWRTRAAALLREPLVHFLVLGALVFVAMAGRAPESADMMVDEAGHHRLINDDAALAHG